MKSTVSVTVGGETRAYPFRILVWHEIVNDRIGDSAFAVTYCPLCGTAMVFDRRVENRTLEFGVSGLLYQSDMLMYDRQTESLWPQIGMVAVSGPLAGSKLRWLPSEQLTWAAWRERYPNGRVLSTDTGHRRNYDQTPYLGYEQTDRLMFPVGVTRREFPTKEWMVGLLIRGEPVAIPLRDLQHATTMERQWTNTKIAVEYDKTADSVIARNLSEDEPIPTVRVFWFAWQAFHPKTTIWRAPSLGEE